MLAIDVFETAIQKAKVKYSMFTFKQLDLLQDEVKWHNKFDLITLVEVIWYLVTNLESIGDKLILLITPNGCLGIKQYFNEYLNSSEDLLLLLKNKEG